jgi:hypothetical protein
MGFYTWLGVGGSILAIIAYLLLQIGYIKAQRGYAVLTLICGMFILLSLREQMHYGTAIINLFFMFISIWGLVNPIPKEIK